MRLFSSILVVSCAMALIGDAAGEPVPAKKIDFTQAWDDLASKDPIRSNMDISILADAGDASIRFLAPRIKPVVLDLSRVPQLVNDLDDNLFRVRRSAHVELRRIGSAVEETLEKALQAKPSPESHRRIQDFLAEYKTGKNDRPETVQLLRALRVLELIGTPQAEAIVGKLTRGTPTAKITRQAVKTVAWIRETRASRVRIANSKFASVGPRDWAQWGGSPARNNAPNAKNIPTTWDVGKVDRKTGLWNPTTGKNIRWVAKLGSQTHPTPTIANGHVFIGTNNIAGYLKRFPPTVDLGVLLCFDERTGQFLWQLSSPKLDTGRVHDWPLQGICSTPLVDGDCVWLVTNRCEVVCADVRGFRDGENDGPYQDEDNENLDEADIVWKIDMMAKFGVSPHNMSNCSPRSAGDILFIHTSNGVDSSHITLPKPDAPSFLALDRRTGKLLWKNNSPQGNILHGQWCSPTYGVMRGRPQVLFGGGDGWLYSFDPRGDGAGNARLLWKFDCNPKATKWILGGRGTRNNLVASPLIHEDRVYIAVGQDPEHGEGEGRLWCIDPTKRGDVSAELAVDRDGKPIPRRRLPALNAARGERAIPNPNSSAIWVYDKTDFDGDGEIEFEEGFHRTISTPVIKDGLLVVSDFSGLVHCLDAKTGKRHWIYDCFSAIWGSPLVVDGKIYITDEDGDVAIFNLSGDPKIAMKNGEPIAEIPHGNSIYSTPVVANGTLFIAGKSLLYAIEAK